MNATRRGLASIAAVTMALSLGAAACSSSAKASAKPPPVVDITATGTNGHWSFELRHGPITGGVVTLRLTNKSTSDPHDFQLLRVTGSHTAAEVEAVVNNPDESAPTPRWLHGAGGVGTVGPGRTGEAMLRLPAGHYFYFCTEDTNGTKHSDHGMFGELDVKGRSGAVLPTATAHVDGFEYGFKTSGLKAGRNLVQFKNTGQELHMVLAAPIQAGKALDDVKKALMSDDQQGPPPIDFEKAVSAEVIDPGQSVYVPWNLSTGRYVLICFMTDHGGGPPHFVNGMIKEVTVQ